MRRAVGFALLILFVMAGCLPDTGGVARDAGDASTAAGDVPDASASRCLAFGCVPGACLCDGLCTEVQNDRANCGACGVACPSGAFCAGGACVDCRAMGQTRCGDTCMDTRDDPTNCGACGRRCAEDQWCNGGVCASFCARGQARCDGRCIAILSDSTNCGACGVVCPSGRLCVAGACTGCAEAGQRPCGDTCVDTRTDRANCGACGVACGTGASCVAGACVPCGGTCAASERCVEGACVPCGVGQVLCGDRCVDLARTMEHCGACGRACAADERCAAGVCTPCPGAALRCGEACVDVSSSQDHCGACGNRCGATQRCFAGRCADRCEAVPPTTCGPGTRCFEGYCTGSLTFLRAPLSTSITTSARPWFRWRLLAGADGAEVEVCATRRCDRTVARWAATGEALRAPVALTPGVYFWRVVGRRGTTAVTPPSVVWEFVVPPPPTLPEADAAPVQGLQVLNDLNGDGVGDEAESRCVVGEGCGFTIRYGRAPGSAATPDQNLTPPSSRSTSDGWTSLYRLQSAAHLGDVNGDGFGDLAVTVFEERYQRSAWRGEYVYVRLYAGGEMGLDTTFDRFGDHPHSGGSVDMIVRPIGDGNRDGMGDFALWTFEAGRLEAYAEYNGGWPSAPSGVWMRGVGLPSFVNLLVGDFDADGASDRVSRGASGGTALLVGLGAGRGMAVLSCTYAVHEFAALFTVIHDANDDGFDDLEVRWGAERALLLGGRRGLAPHTCARP